MFENVHYQQVAATSKLDPYMCATAIGISWLLLVALALFLASCSHQAVPNSANAYEYNNIFFPRQKLRDVVMEALMIGKLVAVNDCLRVNADYGTESYLVVWPSDYSLSLIGGRISVSDGAGRVRVRLGEKIRLSGGETKSLEGIAVVDEQLVQTLSNKWPGPYWLVGAEVGPATNSH